MYDLSLKTGEVLKIIKEYPGMTLLEVSIPGEGRAKAINYPVLTGEVNSGDRVMLNTTAVELKLGTGGYHFVCCNLTNQGKGPQEKPGQKTSGHIMKLRYTPFQVRTLSVEEKESPHHEVIKNFKDLGGHPVVIIPLHSLLAPLAIVFKKLYPKKRVVYIMSEGGSLTLELSDLVRNLLERGFLDRTITAGQAFGGDFEAINIFTALAAAREVAGGDLIIAGMGPGIAGTGTRLGFSGVENAFINYAVRILQGRSIIVPRVSFADKRRRHYGLSHHSVTLLKDLIDNRVELALPEHDLLQSQLEENGLLQRHDIFFYRIDEVAGVLEESGFNFYSMGRRLADDPLFFITAGLAVYRLENLIKE